MMGEFGHGWGMGWWWIIGLIILIIFILIVVKVLKQPGTETTKPEKSALDILKERYAEGEINKQEYEERKKDLM